MCHDDDPYRHYDVAVHEYAHAIDFAIGHGRQAGSFSSALAAAYRARSDTEPWTGSYASRNTAEFWAESVQVWLGVNNGIGGRIWSRLDLDHYGPEITKLISETLGEIQINASCHPSQARANGATRKFSVEGQLTDNQGEPLADTRIQLQETSNSDLHAWTDSRPDGGWGLFEVPGDYRLRFLRDHCSFYLATDGPTVDHRQAEPLLIVDQDIQIDTRLGDGICPYRVSGVVLDSAGAHIQVLLGVQRESPDDLATRRIDLWVSEDGRFAFRFPAPGSYRMEIYSDGCWFSYDGLSVVDYDHRIVVDAEHLNGQDLKLTVPDRNCRE